jgi:hypothetical protein
MTAPDKLAAALRYFEMAVEPKRMAKAREAFKQAYKLDLPETYAEARRAIAAMPSGRVGLSSTLRTGD